MRGWLRWVLGFAAAGMFFLRLTDQPIGCDAVGKPDGCFPFNLPAGAISKWPETFVYSLGQLLPIVTLDPTHDKVELTGWTRYYFTLHRLIGYVLASFVAAGTAGLTQK